MVVHESQAWITSVIDDQEANKAVVLAASLRKVLTRRKIVVLFTSNISKDTRDLLRHKFDLAVLIDENIPEGVEAEDFVKIFAFSFNIFSKCAYLSASTLILQNCDEIFDKYNTSFTALNNTENGVDTSVFVFTPSSSYYNGMCKLVSNGQVWNSTTSSKGSTGKFSQYFGKWLLNQNVSSGFLEEKYNRHVSLKDEKEIYNGLHSDLIIINFIDIHPIEMADKLMENSITTLGVVESFVANTWMQIYMEEFRMKTSSPSLEMQPDSERTSTFGNEPIAIVGMSCRYPGANNVDEFWNLIIEGREGIKTLPHHRWTTDRALYKAPNRNIEAGFLNVPIDEFDAKFFNISPKESAFLDPQQRLLHEVTWEAFEDAAVDPLSLHGTNAGVFVGSWIHDYKDHAMRVPDMDFFRVYMGNSIATEAARLSYFLDITGPSIATESGCSSAIVAVDMACKSLRNGDTNLAIACGVNLLIHPFDNDTLSFVIAPDGRCKTFDSKANGFGRAEGCGVLLMKRLSHAVKNGDKIWGLLRGSAVTQEGVSKSLGTPTVHCEALAMELALKDAGVEPNDVSFIETHGTGTPVGDPLEVAAITKVYSKGRTDPLVIGSVKTNIGHTESVSGITGIIKTVLCLKNEAIPPHLNFETLNPEINLEAIPAEIPLTTKPWPRTMEKPRIAGVSSFGISGTDGHVIVQEAPTDHLQLSKNSWNFSQQRPLHIMKISAKTPESLDDLLKNYQEMFDAGREEFADYAYTANVGRAVFNHRAFIVAKDCKEASKIIKTNSFQRKEVQSSGGKLCFLFTGQGSQYVGMAENLYKTSPVFRMSFDKCDRILKQMYNISIIDTLWKNRDADQLKRTLYSQTSIFCVEYGLSKLWESWGIKPDYVMGHSLGEFAAAVAIEALTLEEALMLVAERSRLIDALPNGKMIVIKADKLEVEKLIDEFSASNLNAWLDYAALNSTTQTVLAGDSETVDKFADFCESKDLKTIILASSHAFHSRHMDPMLESYRTVVSKVNVKTCTNANCQYISGVTGKLTEIQDLSTDYWIQHTRDNVNFIGACEEAKNAGCTLFLEIGPHPVLCALAMANIDGPGLSCFPSLRRDHQDWNVILESVGKLFLSEWNCAVNWKGLDEYQERKKVSLPFYPFQRKKVWVDVRTLPTRLHPLLGYQVENASATTIFENMISLKKLPYLQDHAIGNNVVMPGASFLEMCLTGGYCHVQGLMHDFQVPRRPILLKDLRIEAPLGIDDAKPTLMQTVIDLVDNKDDDSATTAGYHVKVHHFSKSDDELSGSSHWVTHASAMYVPFVADEKIVNMANIDIKNIQQTWEASTTSSDLYRKLPEVGLRFGPTFQSLSNGWESKSDRSFLSTVKVPEGVASYIAHPVIIDAMIQASLIWGKSKDRLHKKLNVPVSVGEFTWLRTSDLEGRFIYCIKDDTDNIRTILLDEVGTPLMTMSGVDFVETTASVVESIIHQQVSQAADFWEEIWRHRPGPLECRFRQRKVEGQIFSNEVLEKALEMNALDDDDQQAYDHLSKATVHLFIYALYQLGWSTECGDIFTVEEIITKLGIPSSFTNFIKFFVKCMIEEGYVSENSEDSFMISSPLPTKANISAFLRHPPKEASRPDFKIIYEVGSKLSEILSGKIHALAVLFPDSQMALADSFYETNHGITTRSSDLLLNAIIAKYLEGTANLKSQTKLRILEVGAGTGCHTGLFLDVMHQKDIPFEYTYTDVSAAFFNKAEVKFEKHVKNMVFKKLDIEMDPLVQGFSPQYYDMIVAAEVIHATKNICQTLANLRFLMREGATIHIVETTKPDRRLTFIFGLLDGYWKFEDHELRPDHVTLSPEKWEHALNSCGFKSAVAIPCYGGVHSTVVAVASPDYYVDGVQQFLPAIWSAERVWLIFGDDSLLCKSLVGKLENFGRQVIVLTREESLDQLKQRDFLNQIVSTDVTNKRNLEGVIYLWGLVNSEERDQTTIAEPYLYLCHYLASVQKSSPRVITVTNGLFSVDESKYQNPSPSTLFGISKVLRTETSVSAKCIDVASDKPLEEQINHIFTELWYQEDLEEIIAYRDGKRYGSRLVKVKVSNQSLNLPKGIDRFQLILPDTKTIADLQFGYLNCYALEDYEVEVKVKAFGLNFRDVFAVIKPDPQFDNVNGIGKDYAGVVTAVGPKVTKQKVGELVFGCNIDDSQALPSHIKLSEDKLVGMPNTLTFAEAATFPVCFSTAFYCLVRIANIKNTDTILIHTASGGVGLSAIQTAQHFGATIIATAGSERKRAYLRSLGVEHVFHSRNTEYGMKIMEVTAGKGVDIVLNSLTGEGFKEASLNACAKNARFIEMSKLSIWKPEEVHQLRPDIEYVIADLTTLNDEEWKELSDHMKQYVHKGIIRPMPYVRFDATDIRGAMNYLQKAKHIGKVVCVMPEIKIQDAKFTTNTPLFNDRSTYMITGGVTGGIGLEVAKWMLSQGAKHLVLVGRSKPNERSMEYLKTWESAGFNVKAWSYDVGDYQQCAELIKTIKDEKSGLPPLRGVMHTAGTLSDSLMENQTWEKFEHTFNAKVNGSWNLHDLTRDCPLEHFVLFSSLAAVFGTPGQANHAAGNYFEDSLAHYRHSIGLPATTINWGPWGQVGVATDIELPGVRPLSTQQGLHALDVNIRANRIQTGVMNVDSFSMLAKFCHGIRTYIDDRSLFAEVKGPVLNLNSDEFWEEVDSMDDAAWKQEVFGKYIKIMIRSILKMDPDEPIEDSAEFQTLGVDSLMMLEMKNNMQNLFGQRMKVTASDLKGCNTTESLSCKLVDILMATEHIVEVVPTPEELQQLIEEDSQLPTYIKPIDQNRKLPSEVTTVLVTGATGVLAPYILRRVSNMPEICKIICIIRKRGKCSAEERLVSILKQNDLFEEIDMSKIQCIEGDIAQQKLGLSENLYEELSESVDAIIHCAAKVDHLQLYRRTETKERSHLRNVNVFGTRNILEFAVSKTTKLIYHASAFTVAYSTDTNGRLSEAWESSAVLGNIPYNSGYILSKFVSEQLFKHAAERGIPCKSFRFPFIAGDSKSGRNDVQANHAILRFITYMKVGMMPSTPTPIVQLPVDTCADISVSLFFNNQTPWDVYNILPPNPGLEQEFLSVAKEFGHNISIVEYSEFLAKLDEQGESSPLYAFMEMYRNEHILKTLLTCPAIPSMESWLVQCDNFFRSEKLQTFCPEVYCNMDYPLKTVQRDLQYLKRIGMFDKFGL
ncbi:unnamed protein product [Orchesella dallaii]|uniref:Erythronolide synthase, modules 3 and 4 n=1 Tax=Orchesella dallaii TaxID=48710 RepID=A0ABP1Q8L1_9HEXA